MRERVRMRSGSQNGMVRWQEIYGQNRPLERLPLCLWLPNLPNSCRPVSNLLPGGSREAWMSARLLTMMQKEIQLTAGGDAEFRRWSITDRLPTKERSRSEFVQVNSILPLERSKH